MVSGRIPTELTDSCALSSESITSSRIITGHAEASGIHAVKFLGHNPSVTKSGQYREGESKRGERAVDRQ
jgi:hypothetical protein